SILRAKYLISGLIVNARLVGNCDRIKKQAQAHTCQHGSHCQAINQLAISRSPLATKGRFKGNQQLCLRSKLAGKFGSGAVWAKN
ncbi:MAG: hypothetical protein ACXWXZ_10560, partial [Candidatus Binatia bacterium]